MATGSQLIILQLSGMMAWVQLQCLRDIDSYCCLLTSYRVRLTGSISSHGQRCVLCKDNSCGHSYLPKTTVRTTIDWAGLNRRS